jgi:hypothetical protein
VVTFGIPLISRKTARDWPSVERLLSNTVTSVLKNGGHGIRVIICCHDVPEIPALADERVVIAQVDFDVPRFRWEQEIDRMRKVEVLGSELRRYGGGWLFVLDADDLIAEGLVPAIRSASTKALLIKNGYRLDARRGEFQQLKRFWRKCGSCCAVKWTAAELPAAPLADDPPIFHSFVECRHWASQTFFERHGWSYAFLDGSLVAYLVNHGQNQSEIITRQTLKWRIYFRLTRWHEWTAQQHARFGTSPRAFAAAVYSGPAKFGTES